MEKQLEATITNTVKQGNSLLVWVTYSDGSTEQFGMQVTETQEDLLQRIKNRLSELNQVDSQLDMLAESLLGQVVTIKD